MTPEERFDRIETNMERLEVWLEKALHEHDQRIRKLEEMQIVLMESQNDTWRAVESLTKNVEKMIRGPRPNGQDSDE